jgi:hypothetical protein
MALISIMADANGMSAALSKAIEDLKATGADVYLSTTTADCSSGGPTFPVAFFGAVRVDGDPAVHDLIQGILSGRLAA